MGEQGQMEGREVKLCTRCGEALQEEEVALRWRVCGDCKLQADIDREEAREARRGK
jgi:hypothetical protein